MTRQAYNRSMDLWNVDILIRTENLQQHSAWAFIILIQENSGLLDLKSYRKITSCCTRIVFLSYSC